MTVRREYEAKQQLSFLKVAPEQFIMSWLLPRNSISYFAKGCNSTSAPLPALSFHNLLYHTKKTLGVCAYLCFVMVLIYWLIDILYFPSNSLTWLFVTLYLRLAVVRLFSRCLFNNSSCVDESANIIVGEERYEENKPSQIMWTTERPRKPS